MRGIAFSRLLTFVVIVPLAALAVYGGGLTLDSWWRYRSLSEAASVLQLSVATARFCGLIPAEGALSREAIAGGGDPAKLEAQRRVTDEAYRAIREAAAELAVRDAEIDGLLKGLEERMGVVADMRRKLDAKALKSPGDSTAALGPAAAFAIELVGSTAAAVADPALSRRIFGLYATLQFNESGLLQRGTGELALREGKLPPEALAILVRATTLNGTFSKLFYEYAPAQVVAQYNAFDATNGRELAELRRLARAANGTPATEEQVQRWLALNRELTTVAGAMLGAATEIVSHDGNEMFLMARFMMVVYFMVTLGVLASVIEMARSVLHTLRELLGELADALDKMRDGHYDVEIPHVDRADEIGTMARATEGFRENFVRVKERETEQKNAEAAVERRSLMDRLAGEFQKVIGNIVGTVSSASGELATAATTLTQTAETTQQLSTAVAAASEEASSNVQTVASATEEMASSIGEIGRQVQESSQIAGQAVTQARKTDDRITKLAQAASRIGDVTQLITSIAEQTNLLALNATIEAARAGEAGKGFAVVAQEVKQLASQTAKATSEISGQIAEMQAATQESVAAIKEIGGTITRISDIAASIAAAVEQQGASTHEITRNVQQAASGTAKVADNISEVSDGAAKTGTASAEVLAAAKALSGQSDRLKAEVDKFLATVRAA